MSDVLLYLVRLADRCDVNLSAAVLRKVRFKHFLLISRRRQGFKLLPHLHRLPCSLEAHLGTRCLCRGLACKPVQVRLNAAKYPAALCHGSSKKYTEYSVAEEEDSTK